jgi:hypothetical protein
MLLALLIVISVIIVIVFLVAFKYIFPYCPEDTASLSNTAGVYLSLVALPVGVVLSFIVASAWSTFSDAQHKENQEATQILLLHDTLRWLPGGEEVARVVREYAELVIEVDFPLMRDGKQSQEGTALLLDIGDMIAELEPTNAKQVTIFSDILDTYEEVVALRVARMTYTTDGVPPELWWVLVLGVIIVIAVSFFIHCPSLLLQCVLTALVVTALVSMLFLIVILNLPYRGDFALDSVPFEIALNEMELRSKRRR